MIALVLIYILSVVSAFISPLSYRRLPIIKSSRLFSSTSSHLPVNHDKVKYDFINQLNEKLKAIDIVKVEAKIYQLQEEMKTISVNQPNYSILMETRELLLKKANIECEEYKKIKNKLDKALGKNLFFNFHKLKCYFLQTIPSCLM